MMRVMVTGDRNWGDPHPIWTVLNGIYLGHPDMVLIVGDAKGADSIAWAWAYWGHVKRRRYHANWKKYGRAAGPRRNLRMLEHGKPDLVVAFHNHLPGSKGTKHAVREANRRGIRVILVGGFDAALKLNNRQLQRHLQDLAQPST